MITAHLLFLTIASFILATIQSQGQNKKIDRQPAVAGQFYPGTKQQLLSMLEQLFAKAVPTKHISDVRAIIVPHAGYVYSGEVAASGFNQIDFEKEYENIFLIGSSHHVSFDGASIYSQGDWMTPLGKVTVNTELANQLIEKNKIFSNRLDAHQEEHCLEVEVPFLQFKMKKDFRIVPVILGTQSPETCQKIATALRPYFNEKNLFIISTDFSHYPKYSDATVVDKTTADAICTNSANTLIRSLIHYEEAPMKNLATCLCGWTSVLTLMYLTEGDSALEYTHIQYQNSGDSEEGDTNRVVGYNAIVVSQKSNSEKSAFKLSIDDKKKLLALARTTIEQYIGSHKEIAPDTANYSDALKAHCGAFVTLKKHGDLRGCIGLFSANQPLYSVVQEMAIAAATEDHRFTQVTKNELAVIDIEISVLTPMRRIHSIDEFELGKHGIYIRKGNRSGTFLPQVAEETGWTKEQFFGYCAQEKAGIGWDGWKDADLFVYEALVFGEK
ncbi:MAG TPA: AmmeMemoRadiSam system protein B [Bacteroidota bacterium]|nr:AmmeMemoRadiSam system protein B [Bacteroidota bacterium]